MPFSNGEHDSKCLDVIEDYFGRTDVKILDIGPGAGKWYKKTQARLPGSVIDACEIFPKYIKKYSLEDKYRKVHLHSIVDFDWTEGDYDVVIMGDVLEHLTIDDANSVLKKIRRNKSLGIIQVPWMSPQDVYDENVYEIHIQPDLNPEVMVERYPDLEYIVCDKTTGAYYLPVEPRKVKSVELHAVGTVEGLDKVITKWDNAGRVSDLHLSVPEAIAQVAKGFIGMQLFVKPSIDESKFISWNGIQLTLPKVLNASKYEAVIE